MAFKDYKRFIYPGSHNLVEEVANWEFIDSLDLAPYLRLGIENIADFIEYTQQDMICNKGVILPKCCDGEFLTNYIGTYEFGEYIVSRYPEIVLRVREECYDVYNQNYGYFFVYNVKALYDNPEDVKNIKMEEIIALITDHWGDLSKEEKRRVSQCLGNDTSDKVLKVLKEVVARLEKRK